MSPTDLTGNVIEPELGQHILAELAELNADFIDLITGAGTSGHQQMASVLPEDQIDQLHGLSKPAIRRLTSCAFALFDLRLQDAQTWRSLGAGNLPIELVADDPELAQATRRSVCLFTLAAMMYLRHLTDINRFFARLSFGAAPVALDIVSTLPLNRLREIADRYPTLLRSRYTEHPQAWSELLKLAKRNDTEPMLPAKILGYQHLYRN